jgi:hypothetical protein
MDTGRHRYGALAPPVGLEPPAASPPPLELSALFSFSAAVPPPVPLEAPPLEASSPVSFLLLSPLDDAASPEVLVVPVELVEVEVEVVWTAAFSMLVSVGGVMSGVLLGTASETLLPPQAPKVTPPSSTRAATSGTRRAAIRPALGCAWVVAVTTLPPGADPSALADL